MSLTPFLPTSVRRALARRTAGVLAGALLALPARAWAQAGTAMGPVRQDALVNRASVTYPSTTGSPDSAVASAAVTVTRQAGVALSGPFAAVAGPGERIVFAHALSNRGTDADTIALSLAVPPGWSSAYYIDADGDGRLSAGDVPVTGGVPLGVGRSAPLLLVVAVPASATDGSAATLSLAAASGDDARAQALTTDRVTVVVKPIPRPSLSVTKAVDRQQATIGDTLLYTMAFANTGDGATPDAVLADTLPDGLQLVPGSMALAGHALSDAADGDAGTAGATPDGRAVARVDLGRVAPGASGAVTLRAVVAGRATEGTLANVASVAYGDSAQTTQLTATAAAPIRINTARLMVRKSLVGRTEIVLGGQASYRLNWSNPSSTAAHNALLVDSLPAELAFVSASGSPTVRGQVVTWSLGAVAGGAMGTFTIVVKSVARPTGDSVTNRAVFAADNAGSLESHAGGLLIARFLASDLKITKAAGVLEAGLGDAVPYAITLHNAGAAPIGGIVVHDRLPAGLRWTRGGLTGADSATASGQDVTYYVAGPLAPGAQHTVRYVAVLSGAHAGASLINRASATAEQGLVQTDTATAAVMVHASREMQSHAVMGKVWIDRNDDGVQEPGEEGIAGAEVWDASGDVVSTDKEGRFSFRNATPGTHALRLDPLAIPSGYVLGDVRDEVALVEFDGWTTPYVSIRLVPRLGVPAADCACATVGSIPGAVPVAAVTGGRPAPAAGAPRVVIPTITPLRSAEERALEGRRELIEGAGARITAPADGSVFADGHLYVGVSGPAGAHVRLYDGATLLREGALRADGIADFVSIPFAPGPHRVRAATVLDGAERWDSVVVHRSGAPTRVVFAGEVPALHADAAPVAIRARLLDRWGVPITGSPLVTVEARTVSVDATDADASSVGLQLRADEAGWVTIPVRAGHVVGRGSLRVSAARDVEASVPLVVMASSRPLIATGVGQIGIGAAPGSSGAVTVHGGVGHETAVSVSYDSRRGDALNTFFQRGYDPLGEDRYPTFGDGSQARIIDPSTKALSARVEHGLDWIAAGDVETADFGREGEVGSYRRSLTGVSTRIGTGALTWHGFASITRQMLSRTQLRGDGSSGPYVLGGGVRPGTDLVAVEVRDQTNAARIIARQDLQRTSDYQIDYTSGAILLHVPVPATDAYGNPVFLIVTAERLSSGDAHVVGGLRVDLDAGSLLRRLAHRAPIDSLSMGVSGVRDAAQASSDLIGGGTDLVGGDMHARVAGLALGAGVLRSRTADSAGTASDANVRWAAPGDRVVLDAHWIGVGRGMSAAADPRLTSALDQVDLGATARLTDDASLHLHHERERFSQYGVERNTTGLGAEQQLLGRRLTQDLSLTTNAVGGAAGTTALTGRAAASVAPRVDVWVDGSRALQEATGAAAAAATPDELGAGASIRILPRLRLEGSERLMRTPGDSVTYAVSSANLRAEALFGGAVWTGLERSGGGLNDEARASHSALLGWDQRIALGGGWQATSLFERRVGLSRASLADPVRALPFAQPEQDRWSAAAGLSWLPGGDLARFSANGELHDQYGSSGSRIRVAGDAALGAGAALLTLNDWSQYARPNRAGLAAFGREDRSLVGLAFRPVTSEAFNILGKVEWRRTENPIGNALIAPNGADARLIGATDAVWTFGPGAELTTRYAVRVGSTDLGGLDRVADPVQRVRIADHFGGVRADHRLVAGLSLRADLRLLREGQSGTFAWNAAPSLLYDLGGRVTLEGGYRFGALRDPDFAVSGGTGLFGAVSLRFTESAFAAPAAFWRERLNPEP